MEDNLLKRNTDCVYFLASPFTCKKGTECEYRHSDLARLNPRDCWYWLSGSCLNPTCAFRHPPLEIHAEASSQVAPSSLDQSSAPVTKTTVPCYFYFNGFCNKGDTCPFLHEPEETHSRKPNLVNTIADASVAHSETTKAPIRTETRLVSAKKNPGQSEMFISDNGFQTEPKEHVQKKAPKNILELNSSVQTCVSKYKESPGMKRVSLQASEGLTNSDSERSLGSEHSSEDLVDGNTVRDEWWESSPGFDVLVDGETEEAAYEDDPGYMSAHESSDKDHEMEHTRNEQIDYGESGWIKYDPFDGEERVNIDGYSSSRALGRKVDHSLSEKRKFFSVDYLRIGDRNNADLRDYLRKRRMVDSYLETRALGHDFARVRDERQGRHQMHANQRFHRRIASKVERNGVGFTRRRTSAVDAFQRSKPRNSHYNGMRRLPPSSEVQRRSFYKHKRSPQYSVSFAGPKSLSEIKEGKREGHLTKNGYVDFDGPKPLSEILKDKKNTTSQNR